MIKIKRIYKHPEKEDGYRMFVDRLWPRGMAKDETCMDLWLKDIAPSDKLRKWFSHDPQKWEAFKERYKEELRGKKELINRIKQLERENGKITLLYSAKDETRNNAVVLQNILK